MFIAGPLREELVESHAESWLLVVAGLDFGAELDIRLPHALLDCAELYDVLRHEGMLAIGIAE